MCDSCKERTKAGVEERVIIFIAKFFFIPSLLRRQTRLLWEWSYQLFTSSYSSSSCSVFYFPANIFSTADTSEQRKNRTEICSQVTALNWQNVLYRQLLKSTPSEAINSSRNYDEMKAESASIKWRCSRSRAVYSVQADRVTLKP